MALNVEFEEVPFSAWHLCAKLLHLDSIQFVKYMMDYCNTIELEMSFKKFLYVFELLICSVTTDPVMPQQIKAQQEITSALQTLTQKYIATIATYITEQPSVFTPKWRKSVVEFTCLHVFISFPQFFPDILPLVDALETVDKSKLCYRFNYLFDCTGELIHIILGFAPILPISEKLAANLANKLTKFSVKTEVIFVYRNML